MTAQMNYMGELAGGDPLQNSLEKEDMVTLSVDLWNLRFIFVRITYKQYMSYDVVVYCSDKHREGRFMDTSILG